MPETEHPITDKNGPEAENDSIDLSIILINWRMKKDLEHCLASIRAHRHRCRSEVILINKPSGDGTEELIAESYPEVRLIEHDRFGFATMRNVGIKASGGRYCLILDTDIDILPGCFDNMVRFMDRLPDVAGCGGHTRRLNGEIEFNVKRFYQLITIFARRSWLDSLWPDNPWNRWHMMKDKDHDKPFYGDWMAGACFCIRRSIVGTVGDFDESMHYFEDVDWCWRAKAEGYKIAFNPYSRIIHRVQGLSRKGFSRNALIHLRSGVRFWWKTAKKNSDSSIQDYAVEKQAIRPALEQEPTLDLSIVIVNYNAQQLLRDAITTLRKSAPRHTQEIIVVDNASHDGSVAMVREEFPDVILIANKGNAGFTKANNQGIAIAKGRYIVLLNNDTRTEPAAFSKAVEYLDKNPDIGIAGLQLLNDDMSRQLSCRRFPSFSQALFNRYSILTKIFPDNTFSKSYLMTDLPDDEVRDVDWVSGACLVIRRELLEKIGGLDERFFMYSEDVDYCYRCWQADYRVSYLPFAKVVHLIGQSSKKAKRMTIIERHRSMYRFYKKHYSRHLMLIDALTASTVWSRCGFKLIPVFFREWREKRGAAS